MHGQFPAVCNLGRGYRVPGGWLDPHRYGDGKRMHVRDIVMVCLRGGKVGWLHRVDVVDQKVRSVVAQTLETVYGDSSVPPSAEDYVAVDWCSLRVIQQSLTVGRIHPPGIVILLPVKLGKKLRVEAARLKEYTLRVETKARLYMDFKALGILSSIPAELLPDQNFLSVENVAGTVRTGWTHQEVCSLGSRERPFPSASRLLAFLKNDAPQRFVFRGQTREYAGSLLPSAFRTRLRAGGPPPFAGVTRTAKELYAEAEGRLREHPWVDDSASGRMVERDEETVLDVAEGEYDRGFRQFFEVSYARELEALRPVLGVGTGIALQQLFGGKAGCLLAQQYGLTSEGLDCTTVPEVAAFFATHEAPYYFPVSTTSELGVIYRWPKEEALVGQDVLSELEGEGAPELPLSFWMFVLASKGLLFLSKNRGLQWEDHVSKRYQRIAEILVRSADRDFAYPVFPKGTFAQSRVGRQGAALLVPRCCAIDHPPNASNRGGTPHTSDQALVLEDIIGGRNGQAFYFRHSRDLPDLGVMGKSHLWPVFSRCSVRVQSKSPPSLVLGDFDFQDKYLEFFLRFLSPFSPVTIWLMKPVTKVDAILDRPTFDIAGNKHALFMAGSIFVSPGFAIHPDEASNVVARLMTTKRATERRRGCTQRNERQWRSLQGDVTYPIGMLIPSEVRDEFAERLQAALRDALSPGDL